MENGIKNVDMKVDHTKWGVVRRYKHGDIYDFVLYKYNDDNLSEFLSDVHVAPSKRGNGYGNILLNIAKEEAISHGSKYLFLTVVKESWTHNWYERHGFTDHFSDYQANDEDKLVWMKCYLGKSSFSHFWKIKKFLVSLYRRIKNK